MSKYRRQDPTGCQQNTIERPRTLGSTECNHAIRQLNGTDNPQLIAFDESTYYTCFDDVQGHRLLQAKQPHFWILKLSMFHYAVFDWITNSQLTCSELNNLRKS